MSAIKVEQSTILYRNPDSATGLRNAYFPSLITFPDGEMLCSVVIGEAFESVDCRVHLCRSRDRGKTWEFEEQSFQVQEGEEACYSARLSLMGGALVLLLFRFDRSQYPGAGLTNPATLGFVPQTMYLLRSVDRGKTWSKPEKLSPPIEGPCFELCSPIRELSDGRWILPTQTWMDWEGNLGDGLRMVAFVSHDKGQRWSECMNVMCGQRNELFFWESKVVEMAGGRLVSVAWAHDRVKGCDLQNHWTYSDDGGKSWSSPAQTGLHGQTVDLIRLKGGEILCVYRRTDQPGLWGAIVDTTEGWQLLYQTELWSGSTGMKHSSGMSENFANLRFGAPSLCQLPDGSIVCAFWCYESEIANIRLLHLKVP